MSIEKNKSHTITHSILTSLLVIIITIFLAGMCFFANIIFAMREEINSIQSYFTTNLPISEDTNYYDTYIALSEKAEAEMSRLVSIVGILATAYTIFGALIVFRAPREIDKRINKLDRLIAEAGNSAQEARYQAEIIDAVANNYNGEMTNYDKLRRISNVIDKYPTRPDAYMERGFIYDNMGKYDEAISDYKIGRKNGVNKSSYYVDMGVAFNKKRLIKRQYRFTQKRLILIQMMPLYMLIEVPAMMI